MKRFTYFIPFAALLLFAACKEDKKTVAPEVITVETSPEEKVYTSAKGDAAFKDAEMAKVFDMYIALKTAFVNTNDAIQVKKTKDVKKITFGDSNSDIQIQFIDATPFVNLKYADIEIQSQLIGDYNFSNIAIAIAIGNYFKIEKERKHSPIAKKSNDPTD